MRPRKLLQDGAGQCLSAIDDKQATLFRIQTAIDEIRQQGFANSTVFRRSLPQAQAVFAPIARDSQRDDHALSATMYSIQEHGTNLQIRKFAVEQFLQFPPARRDEVSADAALLDAVAVTQ